MLDKSQKTGSVNFSEEEIAKFDALAESWWNPKGKYRTALEFNRARLEVIKSQINSHFGIHHNKEGYSSLSIIDIGSGGGLISEPLAQLGADVTGIDASSVSVEVATRHAAQNNVDVTYKHMVSSEMVKDGKQFDVVINAEVVEHVSDQQQLIEECASMVKPGGLLVLATLNRTLKSFIIAIVGAEYVMRYLPIGTHDWRKFVKPAELEAWVGNDFTLNHQIGMKLNPLKGEWLTTPSLSVNFIQAFSKHE